MLRQTFFFIRSQKRCEAVNMNDLTKGNIYKTFLVFAIPLIVSGFLSQASSIINTAIAGKNLSAEGLAAIGSTAAFITFFSSVFWGYGNGFSIYVARLFGEKAYSKLKSAIYANYAVMTVVVVLLSVGIICCKDPLFDFLKVDPAIRKEAGIYFQIYMLGSVLILLNAHGVYLMNALGSGSYPLLMSIISTTLLISGNLFSVKVLHWGVAGIALTTILAALLVDLFYVLELKRCFRQMGVGNEKVTFQWDVLKKSVHYALPTTFQQMVMYFASLMIAPLVNGIGSSASAAYVLCQKVYDINGTVYQNSSKTLTTYAAQSIGAGKYENIQKGFRMGLLQGMVFQTPVLILTVVFAKQLCSFFLPEGYAGEELSMAITFARYFLPFLLFNLVNNLYHSLFRGVASMKYLVTATTIGACTRMIATYLTVPRFGMNGVYIGWVISWIVECVFSVSVYLSGKWKPIEMKEIEK